MMLTGSSSEKMDRWGLRSLSTFGILPDFTQVEVSQLLDALAAARLVESEDVDRFRPILNLSERGWAIVRGLNSDPIELSLPEPLATKVRLGGLQRIAAAPARDEPPAEADEPGAALPPDPLRDHLRDLRNRWAREANVPAYCVFHNETIEAIVLARPRTPAELARIKGFGPSKLEKYGEPVLQAIRSVGEGVSSPPPSPSAPAEPEASAGPGRAVEEQRPSPPILGEDGLDLDDRSSGRPSTPKAAGSNGTIRRESGADNSPSPRIPAPATASAEPYVSTEEWTFRLFDRGFRLGEIAAIRGLDRPAVVRHATWMARKGRVIAPELLVEAETLARWHAWASENGDAPPPGCSDEERGLWGLFVLCRKPG
jgi:ATP-dependent DNA helicase RecQ